MPDVDAVLAISLQEYAALRAEMVSTVERQYSIGNWAISSVALMVAGIVGGWGALSTYPLLLIGAIYLAVPLLVSSHVLAWTHVVSGIAALGWRLHQIETNIAALVGDDLVRQAYRVPPAETVNPFAYLLGWEHSLWQGTSNARLQATTAMITKALGIVYIVSGAIGTVAWNRIAGLQGRFVALVIGILGVVYLVAWVTLRRYVRGLVASASPASLVGSGGSSLTRA